jgi:dipeptidyl aminopeptidase/acylaminoacyl peptidase
VGDRATEWPSWSPDSREITFTSRVDGRSQIFLIGADGGAPTRFKTDFDAAASTWSHDGRWIYFESTMTGHRQIWRMSASGENAIQVTRNGGRRPMPSQDGRYIYYAKGDEIGGIWRLRTPEQDTADARETLVIPAIQNLNFAIMNDGIYFVAPESSRGNSLSTHIALGDKSSITYYDLSARTTKKLILLDRLLQYGFSVSPDSRWILYTQTDSLGADLRMIENFR